MSSAETVQLEVIPGAEMPAGDIDVMVRITPPEGEARVPSDICCIVDVSGSMGSEAMLKSDGGRDIGHGLSVLDVVKHSMKTIIKNLTDNDRLALVAYSNEAEVIFPLTIMSAAGRTETEGKLQDLQPEGRTNLWAGLRKGIDVLKASPRPGSLQHVMLFTDGLPNINPPRGVVPMLERLKDRSPNGRLPCTINTFGFGYELDSEMLSQLAIVGSGAYNFIPCAGFVGTVFNNSMANLLVTMAKDTVLELSPQNGAIVKSVMGGHPTKQDGSTSLLSLGSLQYGQWKDVVVKMSVPEAAFNSGFLQATLKYGTHTSQTQTVNWAGIGKPFPPHFLEVEAQKLRLHFVDAVRDCVQACKLSTVDKAQGKAVPLGECRARVDRLVNEIRHSEAICTVPMQRLLEDAEGQVVEALSREEWYTKWGMHYLPSLMFAHLTQQCNNFKDAGVQTYGGELFNKLREAADADFTSTSAAPSVRPAPAAGVARPSAAAAPPPRVDMTAFHDRFAGCVDGSCSVRLADGSSTCLADVRRGDSMLTPGGGAAAVACVVRTPAPKGRYLLTELEGGLRLTPHHPVCIQGQWRFPAELAPAREVPCEAVYSLLLEEGTEGAVLVEGVPCVSLGHGLEAGAARHPFFGCRTAVEGALAKLPGFEDGFVELGADSAIRNPETGLVCGFTAAKAQPRLDVCTYKPCKVQIHHTRRNAAA